METDTIGVGVIGCGEIAQLMHLPYLAELPEFRIAGLCDISPGTVAAVAAQYHVADRYTDYRQLLAQPGVDAVVVCTYDHAGVVADAIAAGKHVIVEKPLAFTPDEARPLVAAAAAAGVTALVGYMKAYDGGYQRAVAVMRAAGTPRAIQVHDFAGRFDRHGALYTQQRVTDLPPEALAAGRAAVNARIDAALGPGHAAYRDLYLILLMLGSHDLAALRGVFGSPERVSFARPVGDTQLLAVLEYAGGVPCIIEIGVGAQYEWWDEWLAMHGDHAEIRIDFPNPYVRHAATAIRIREGVDGAPCDQVIHGPHDTPFRREWRHFAECIRSGTPPLTPLADGLADLELAVDIIKAMPPKREAAR